MAIPSDGKLVLTPTVMVVSRLHDDAVADAYRAALASTDDGSWSQPKADPVKPHRAGPRRNELCGCGSGRKWKKCCMKKAGK